ncbi:hypothetical protein Tco_1335845 [Tanacetum coccineum]
MSSMLEDIQCVGSNTRPPMLDRTDFESWQQRIRLYYLGKDNGENIMKSINEGPFQMGTMRDTLTKGGEGAFHLGPERARVFAGLSAEQKDRFYMENSKQGTIPMQEKLKFSKSQGASTPAEIQRMQNIPYASTVGSIMYVNPGDAYWTAIMNILKYLRNTKDMFLVYGGDMKRELKVSCYTDVGYLTDADDIKSQTGYVFVLNRGVVDWKSTKQSIFVASSIDVEYIAAFDASREAIWICKFIFGLGTVPIIKEPINMYCDNTGAIAIAKDYGVTKGARHFYAKVHYLREMIEMGDVRIEKVDTDDNLADPFTKALAFPK